MNLSIIVPVYNAEDTIKITLRSILEQLPSGVEVIVVDDGSTDSTPDYLATFSSYHPDIVHVFRQGNAGAANARNVAINHASGNYLAFIDADDRFLEGSIETILKEIESGNDIIGWDWQTINNGTIRHFQQADYSDVEKALKNLMGGTMKWNLWLFAVKRSMVMDNGIRFLDGADMGEDMAFMLKCFACAGSVRQIHEPLYEYNVSNPASISQQMSPRRREEVSRNLESARVFFYGTEHEGLFRQYLPHLKLYIKLPLLISLLKEDYTTWYNWYPESNAYAMGNPVLPFRTRLLQWLASKRLWGLVKSYNLLYRSVIGML